MNDFTHLTDLASERVGGVVLAANDDFFAPKENLVKASSPVWREHDYTDRGKWMDGWETRRRRTPGHDWCILRLGVPGILRGVVVDTSFFRGNFPEHCSLDACALEGQPGIDQLTSEATRWVEVLPKSPLRGDSRNLFPIAHEHGFTHLRFRIYPDGGVARLRVHGEALPDWKRILAPASEIDLAALLHGGRVVECSDKFFSAPYNLLMPGRPTGMHDGWETKRRRGPGYDWVIVRLGIAGQIGRIEVDTSFFRGNFPESCSIEICEAADDSVLVTAEWAEILPRTKLLADTRHVFDETLVRGRAATYLRLNIFPDGGVARLRVWGTPTRAGLAAEGLRRLNALLEEDAAATFFNCCGAKHWAAWMAAARPFASLEQLGVTADKCFQELTREDLLEAFRAHPRIGEKRAAQASAESQLWSEQEQARLRDAAAGTLAALAEANRAYEQRFGHIFIVCATARTPEEMLAACRERMANDPEKELRAAAEEQRRITHRRLEKLFQL